MISKEVIRSIIREGRELLAEVTLYERPQTFEPAGRYVLVGIRQAGKSYMLYQHAKTMLAEGHSAEEMVFVNFDDERLLGVTVMDLDTILQISIEESKEKPILFFDEIQNIVGWEHFARRLANSRYQVFITGSNARMLSRDIATTLGGRYLEMRIFPYSFREYVCAKGVMTADEEDTDRWMYGKKRTETARTLAEFFRWGGFPELMLFNGKRQWLNALYDKILLGDVIQRNGIKNEQAVRLMVKRLAENTGQPISYNRLANIIKATGVNTSTASVIEYVGFVKDACILFSIDNYASKFTDKETVKKHYFTDNGLLNIFLHTDGNAALHENLCATELYRRYGETLFYYNRNVEVDFYIPEERTAIQACYSTEDTETLRRETEALRKLDSVTPLDRMVIISYDEERVISLDNDKRVEVIPLPKWLLKN